MQALTYSRFGSADCLQLAELDAPHPRDGQVLVQVAAAGLNPIDVKTRAGKGFVAQQLGHRFRFVPGYDLAGTLLQGSDRLPAGAAVIGMVGFPLAAGACAQVCAVDPPALVAAPGNLPLAEAAGLPLAGLTAWQGLFQHGALQPGQRLLVLAGAGGVGHLAVQLGGWAGASVGATASAGNHPFLSRLGVSQCMDYRVPGHLAGAGQWDLILDLVGGNTGRDALPYLAPTGLMLTVPTITAAELTAAGEAQGKRVLGYTVQPNREHLQQLVALVEAGSLRLHISRRFPLDQAAEAHRLLESGHVNGKVILEMPLG